MSVSVHAVGMSLLVAVGATMLEVSAAQAQIGPSGWAEVPDVPGLTKLDGGASLAADDSGSVVLVGFKGGKAQSALAWHSTDGTTWKQVALPGAKGSAAFSTVSGPGGFVAVGGGKNGGRIWHSSDGATWSDVGRGLASSGAVYDVTATPDGYIAVGFVNKGKGAKARSTPVAWSSSDGESWTASPLAKVPGAGLDIAASPDGTLVATLYQPQRRGPKRGRSFEILSPSLEFLTSDDGTYWRSVGKKPFVENLGYLGAWDLSHAGDRFVFRADRLPNALSTIPDGFYASTDGTTWEPLSVLGGLHGALLPVGPGAIAVGQGPVLLSDDGNTWRSSYADALAGAAPRSLATLPGGRVLAVADAPGKQAKGARLYAGTPDASGPVLSTECLDPAVEAQLSDSGVDPFGLPAPEREAIAAQLAALDLTDADPGQARDTVVNALRSGATGDSAIFALYAMQVGDVDLPVCA